MMETPDDSPKFPYYSAELTGIIGIPDHPAIHLAIWSVAELLMPAARIANPDPRLQRIIAVRAASAACLWSWPIESAENFVLEKGPVPPHEVRWPAEVYGVQPTDWLQQANKKLRSEGIDIEPDARRMKTRLGWDERALIPGESLEEQREAYLRQRRASAG